MKPDSLVRRPLSLALRLTLIFGIAAAGIFIVFGWIISRSTEAHFAAEDTSELQIVAGAVLNVLANMDYEGDHTQLKRRFDDILVGHHSALLYIGTADEESIYASPGSDFSAIVNTLNSETHDGTVRQWDSANHSYRVLIQGLDKNQSADSSYTIAVAVPIDVHLRFLDSFRRTLWLMIVMSIALMSLMGWIAARHGHAPLHEIVNRIRQISAKRLDAPLSPETLPSELTDLAISFNAMLHRVDDAFQRLSDFSADIAHELRTPVTNMMTQAQVALTRARSIEEYREILYSNVEEYERMAQMIGDMLFLAKADNGLSKNEITQVDLTTEVQDLFDYYEGWAEERRVALTLTGAAEVEGDRRMIRRALGNLLSNAIRHTPPGKAVHVSLSTSAAGEITISIENPGVGISPEHLPRLFNRFHRVDPSRQQDGDGAGLGLAIVKSIIEAHRGEIQVTSEQGRTRFRISLPDPRPETV